MNETNCDNVSRWCRERDFRTNLPLRDCLRVAGEESLRSDNRTPYLEQIAIVDVMKKSDTPQEKSPSQLIDQRIEELNDWRGETLRHIRNLIKEADPTITEEWKWVKPSNPGTPVWSHNGIVCTGESYKDHIKLTFLKGASIKDPQGIFTQMGTQRRAIDLYEGDKINDSAFKNLVRDAVTLNLSAKKK